MNNKIKSDGISLIVLVITIIVIIILAGAVILSLSRNNPINSAIEATFKNNLQLYRNELSLYIANEYSKKLGNLDLTTISASKTIGTYDSGKTVQQIITSMPDADVLDYIIYEGKLIYTGSDTNKKEWAKDTAMENSYVSNGLLLWLEGENFATNLVTSLWLDKSGNNNHGIPRNFSYVTTSGNDGNSGVAFDGINDNVVVNNPIKGASSFTIGFWIKHNSPALWSDIFTFNTDLDGTAGRVEFTGTNDYRWYCGGSFISGALIFTHDGTSYDYIVIKCDGINVYCYKNGVMTYSGVKEAGNIPSCDTINIGFRLYGSYWHGNIRKFHIYNRALTSSEILQNYTASL